MAVREAGKLPVVLGWATGQDGWGGDMNRNLALLSTLAQLTIESVTATSPPTTAAEWSVYAVASNPTGAWAGQGGRLGILIDGAWEFVVPSYGWLGRLRATNTFVWWDGETWVDLETGEAADGGDTATTPTGQKVAYFRPGAPAPDELFVFAIDQPLVLNEGSATGTAFCEQPPTSAMYYRIHRNGTEIGKLRFAGGSYDGVFEIPSTITFGVGDRLIFTAPAEAVPGLSDVSFVLRLQLLGN